MRKIFLFPVLLLMVSACMRNDAGTVTPASTTEDPDWIKLEIPSGREAYAIAGDIDKTLLVTTWTKAYYTTDQGKTWQQSKDFQGPIPGLFMRNDTTYTMQARTFDRQGNLIGAGVVYNFTLDYGKTWQLYDPTARGYIDDIQPIGQVKSTAGTTYSLKENLTPTAPGSASFYINPSNILRKSPSGQETVRFPFKQHLINLYLDQQNRLYVAASGGTYQTENNSFYCCTPTMPAVVYVSKRPLP